MAILDWNTLIEQAKAEGFSNEVIPAGPYEVEVASVKVGNSKGGHPSVGVRLKVIAGPHNNVSLWDNLYVTPDKPKGMAMFLRKAVAYGADLEAFKRGESLEQIANTFVGRRGIADVTVEPYQGNDTNKIAKFTPSTSGIGAFVPSAAPAAPPAAQGGIGTYTFTLPSQAQAAGGTTF